jgi:hypothetical protein
MERLEALLYFMSYLWREKVFYCGPAEVLSPQKNLRRKVANSQNAIPQITWIDWALKSQIR